MTLFVAGATLLAVPAAQAQGQRHARLSEELSKKLDQGDTQSTSVIVSGSQTQALGTQASGSRARRRSRHARARS